MHLIVLAYDSDDRFIPQPLSRSTTSNFCSLKTPHLALLITCKTPNPDNVTLLIRCNVLTILTSKSAMLRTSWSNKIKRDMRGATDILMWKMTIRPGIALTHHSLTNKVHSSHDKKWQYYTNDRTNGTTVWLCLIWGWLCFFWKERRKKKEIIKHGTIYMLLSWSLCRKSVSLQSFTQCLWKYLQTQASITPYIWIQCTRLPPLPFHVHKAVLAWYSPFCLSINLVTGLLIILI